MLRKSILIGLFVLKNNRTIGENLFSGGYGRHREMEQFSARAVMGGTGVNGLNKFEFFAKCSIKFRSVDLFYPCGSFKCLFWGV